MPWRVRHSEDQLILDQVAHRHLPACNHPVRGIYVRGLGVMFRVSDPLEYWDGEE